MGSRRTLFSFLLLNAALALNACAQGSTSSNKYKAHTSEKPRSSESSLDAGSVNAGVYRNPLFGFTCKIPAGWVLRTEEMNAREGGDAKADEDKTAADSGKAGRVLLAAFSRPPEARAEDVNASILIAAENAGAYPGLKEAAQYFEPVIEAAKAQGLEIGDDPFEFAVGPKKLVRGDFQKDVGTRVMRQSTLVILARGYVVSFTFIGGTDDEVEELIQHLSFGATTKPAR